jgi:thiol-disulfide isomerase/thioredoxin
MKRTLLLLSIVVLAFSACKNNSIIIKGTFKEGKKKTIQLNKLDLNSPVFMDSAKLDSKGNFRLRIKANEAEFYQLGFSSNDFITLLAKPGEKIKVVANGKKIFEKYSVSGSPESEKLRDLDSDLSVTISKLDSLRTLYAAESSRPGFETRSTELEQQYLDIIKAQRLKNINFIINNTSSLASIKALYQKIDDQTYVLHEERDLQYKKIVSDSLKKYYPTSKHVQALLSDFSTSLGEMNKSRLSEFAMQLPETKLDPNLMDINGNRIALSSLKGKYVLVTFWSVKSNDCITENLMFKEIYRLYHNRGLEIYQINIDQNENDWKAAVKFDELPWISTREDNPANPVNARIFNVQYVPSNYLFDKDGNLMAMNLHGRSLQIKLDQLFN